MGFLGKTKMKAYTKLTVVMCSQIDDQRPFPPAAAAAAGLCTEPETAGEIVSFFILRPVYVFYYGQIKKCDMQYVTYDT